MKRGDFVSEFAHHRCIQAPGVREMIDEIALIEATHGDHPVNGRMIAAESKRAVGTPRDLASPR